MVQYISRNIVTDTMRENEERNRQLALQEMERRNRQAQEQLARGVAGIYAEGAPQPAIQTSTETNYGIAPARSSIGLQMPAGNEFGLQRGKSLSGFIAPSEIPTEREVTQTVPAAQDTRAQRAMQLATQTPGGGQLAMQMAQSQMSGEAGARKEREAREDKVLEMLAVGNIQGAKLYAQQNGLNSVLPIFSNPRALAMITTSSQYGFKKGLTGRELGKFNEVILEGVAGGQSYDEAFANANAAVASMTNAPRGRSGNGVVSPRRDNPIRRSYTAADGYVYSELKYPDSNGKPMIVQHTDANGSPIRSNEISRFAGQVYLKSADLPGASVESAQQVANQLYPSGQQPAPNNNSSGKVRRYVPGKGFSE